MFTAKFYQSGTNGDNEHFTKCASVSCSSYQHYTCESSETVMVFNSMVQDTGAEYHIKSQDKIDKGDERIYFDVCYVENMAGKTIATYGEAIG